MKMLKAILVAAGVALAAGSVTATADAQPRDHRGDYGHGYHHAGYGRGDHRGWNNHHRRCRTEYRQHHRVTRCW